MEGKVTEARLSYQRITYVKPTEHHYESAGEKPYIKYGCPVCELLDNKHQVTFGASNCSLCNVNLLWQEPQRGDLDGECCGNPRMDTCAVESGKRDCSNGAES